MPREPAWGVMTSWLAVPEPMMMAHAAAGLRNQGEAKEPAKKRGKHMEYEKVRKSPA